MEHVRKHFKKNDPVLYAAIKSDNWHTLTRTHDRFAGLCRIVVGQQVSTKAAASIYQKFAALFPRKKPTAKGVLKLSEEELRSAGLSRSKALSILDIAKRVESKELDLKNIGSKNNEEVIKMLIEARGIGPWSAEMFLIFYLGREDVFSPGDYGLRVAIMKLYKKRTLPTPEASKKHALKWAPYRSYACLILWESLDNTPDAQ
jgi:3-methyladenine DNA glycosylase/8-oxoguanine DNA glycosylase